MIVGGGLCGSCVGGGMLHGSGAWPVGKESVAALQRAGMGVVGWMCGVKLKDGLPSEELRGGWVWMTWHWCCGRVGCAGAVVWCEKMTGTG